MERMRHSGDVPAIINSGYIDTTHAPPSTAATDTAPDESSDLTMSLTMKLAAAGLSLCPYRFVSRPRPLFRPAFARSRSGGVAHAALTTRPNVAVSQRGLLR